MVDSARVLLFMRLNALDAANVDLAPSGTTGDAVEWELVDYDGTWSFIISKLNGQKLHAKSNQGFVVNLVDPKWTGENQLWKWVGVPAVNDWETYVFDNDLSGVAHADSDNDGHADIREYALGGHAGNSNVVPVSPRLEVDGDTARFFHLKLTNSNSGIGYLAEWTDRRLVSGVWTNDWVSVSTGSSTNPGFSNVEYETASG